MGGALRGWAVEGTGMDRKMRRVAAIVWKKSRAGEVDACVGDRI